MDYPNKTMTLDGDNLLSSANGSHGGVVIDKVILSDKLPTANKSLESMSLTDISDRIVKDIDVVKHQQNTSQPEITINNQGMTKDYPINTIGLLAHAADDASGYETLYTIATADSDPFIMPKQSSTRFDFTIAVPIAISNSKQVRIESTQAGTVSAKDFDDEINRVNDSLTSLGSKVDGGGENTRNIASLAGEMNDIFTDSASSANSFSNLTNSVDTINTSISALNIHTHHLLEWVETNSRAVSANKDSIASNGSSITLNSYAIENQSTSTSVLYSKFPYDESEINSMENNMVTYDSLASGISDYFYQGIGINDDENEPDLLTGEYAGYAGSTITGYQLPAIVNISVDNGFHDIPEKIGNYFKNNDTTLPAVRISDNNSYAIMLFPTINSTFIKMTSLAQPLPNADNQGWEEFSLNPVKSS